MNPAAADASLIGACRPEKAGTKNKLKLSAGTDSAISLVSLGSVKRPGERQLVVIASSRQ